MQLCTLVLMALDYYGGGVVEVVLICLAFLCGAVPAGIIGVVLCTTSVLFLCMVVVLIVMYDFYYWYCAGTVCYDSCFLYM